MIVHARSPQRTHALQPLIVAGADLVVADFADGEAVRHIADELNRGPVIDTVVHNAGVYSGAAIMPVNVIAPYLLTALLTRPRRHVYVSSGMHTGGRPSVVGIDWTGSRRGSYSDSKLFVTTLAAALARLRPEVASNAVDPGWVPTRMGGPGAPDDLELGHRTQEWLAATDDPEANTTGGYWYHRRRRSPHLAVHDVDFQNELLRSLHEATGVRIDH